MENFFAPVFSGTFTFVGYIVCTLTAMALGALVALSVSVKGRATKSFALTLVLLPPIVETVLILVNGNLGTGIAVMGAFSLVRFRSTPGSAMEIVSIFMSMAIGVATALGYLGLALVFTVLVCAVMLIFALVELPEKKGGKRELKITVPESLNYLHAFDEVFDKYTRSVRLVKAKTASLGSLYKLTYEVEFKDPECEKKLIDDLRIRNGNLEISVGIICEREEF